jgi:hypothetical protein
MNALNLDLIFEISDLALAVLRNQKGETRDTFVEDTLLQIIDAAEEAYEQHTGEPLHPEILDYENEL